MRNNGGRDKKLRNKSWDRGRKARKENRAESANGKGGKSRGWDVLEVRWRKNNRKEENATNCPKCCW
jgi:hypothetical protein